jgi:transcription elongation factor GreA
MSSRETILTPEGLKKLQDEIEYLSTTKREEVAERIRQARDFGDISENSEYDDAKNEQAMLEYRISALQEKLSNARVVKTSEISTQEVSLGSVVEVKDLETDEVLKYRIVGSAEADPTNNRVSNESPIGQALLEQKVGDVITVPAPVGSLKFEILAIGAH